MQFTIISRYEDRIGFRLYTCLPMLRTYLSPNLSKNAPIGIAKSPSTTKDNVKARDNILSCFKHGWISNADRLMLTSILWWPVPSLDIFRSIFLSSSGLAVKTVVFCKASLEMIVSFKHLGSADSFPICPDVRLSCKLCRHKYPKTLSCFRT